MTKRDERALRELIEKWQKKLALAHWSVRTFSSKKPAEEESIMASVSLDTEYLQASITVYPSWVEANHRDREHAIVHELCHLIAEELAQCALQMLDGQLVTRKHVRASVERLVETMARNHTRRG